MGMMSDLSKTMAERVKDSVLDVTKDWAKQRKAEERQASALANRYFAAATITISSPPPSR
jgi:hypothetical protein